MLGVPICSEWDSTQRVFCLILFIFYFDIEYVQHTVQSYIYTNIYL